MHIVGRHAAIWPKNDVFRTQNPCFPKDMHMLLPGKMPNFCWKHVKSSWFRHLADDPKVFPQHPHWSKNICGFFSKINESNHIKP